MSETAIDRIVRRVAELPDRCSPDDWPEAMLVTGDELTRIIEEEFESAPAETVTVPAPVAPPEPGEDCPKCGAKFHDGVWWPLTEAQPRCSLCEAVGVAPPQELSDALYIAGQYEKAPCFAELLGEVDEENPCTCPTCGHRAVLRALRAIDHPAHEGEDGK